MHPAQEGMHALAECSVQKDNASPRISSAPPREDSALESKALEMATPSE